LCVWTRYTYHRKFVHVGKTCGGGCFVKSHFLLPAGGAMTVGEYQHVHVFRAGLSSYMYSLVQM
jgi:hypothetical protein